MSRTGIAAVLLILLFSFCCHKSWSADNINFKLKPITKEQTQSFKPDKIVVTVDGTIIKGESIKNNGRKYIDAELLSAVLKAMKINSSFDLSVMAFAMENPRTAVKLPSSDPNGNLTVVIGSNIIKTEACVAEQKAYINYRFIETLIKGLGYEIKSDPASSFMTVASRTESTSPADATPPVASGQPVVTAQTPAPQQEKDGQKTENHAGDVQAISVYMNALKKIFDDNAPEKSGGPGQAGDAPLDPTTVKAEDLKPVIEKQKKIIDEINKLNPPEAQTGEIQKLAIGVMAKMLRATELSAQIFSLPEGRRKPSVEEEILELNRQILEEQALFNKKVIILREKYNLGKP